VTHRISAGVLLEHEGKILLVRHHKPGAYDFWVAPGGGAVGTEDLRETARREVLEECGLIVEPETLAYVEEFHSPQIRTCKAWFTARLLGGSLNVSDVEAAREHIVEAAFLARSEFDGKIVFPLMLRQQYWEDKLSGFTNTRYVGLRTLDFY
jgi:ADP-ribose pyrophosphatase YjhB (NUDIX family)